MTEEENNAAGEPRVPGIAQPDLELMARLNVALKAKGADYRPRTHHLQGDGSPEYTNRLILETSPYLLQHAHNPVNWQAWGSEAFERAKRENKPIFLSVGYSTCHWCHVMEKESFEDVEIARFINEKFVAIKVDREERPDIDAIYMTAVRFLSGRGGWPMTIVMTPDKDPFFGGTYLPPRDGERGARKGLLSVLRDLSLEYQKDSTKLIAHAQETSRKVAAAVVPVRPGNIPGQEVLDAAAQAYRGQFDVAYGGFGRAPKFPRPSSLDFLLRHQRRARLSGTDDIGALNEALSTLRHMAAGGIFDHVGGGFHRYSTDSAWLVPHFEKMLYDNAQLVSVYLDAYQITGEELFATVARRTLDYLLREMRDENGAFYSASDADSRGPSGHAEEGYFYTWTPSELRAALSDEQLQLVTKTFGVSEQGNFEGRSILFRSSESLEPLSSPELNQALEKLYGVRAERPLPAIDQKVLTSWNALTVHSLARAGFVLGEGKFVSAAQKAAEHLLTHAKNPAGGYFRSTRGKVAKQPGFLDDHAFFESALIELALVTGEPRYLQDARALQRFLDEQFWDQERGGYFQLGASHEALLAREKPVYDGAEPSGNSIAVENLLRLSLLTGEAEYRKRAEKCFSAFAGVLSDGGSAPRMLAALHTYLDTSLQVVVVRPDQETGAEAMSMFEVARLHYLPQAAVVLVTASEAATLSRTLPFLEGKTPLQGKAAAFVCERGSCELPARSAQALSDQLKRYAMRQAAE